MVKRFFDIIASTIGLILLLPIFLIIPIALKIDSRGPVFFRQKRIGRNFKPFKIIKFRTMELGAERNGSMITLAEDERVTKFGRFLRKHKLDEFPQFINVLKGDMSFIGPRPEVEKYVELYRTEYQFLLRERPGISDPASVKFNDEERLVTSEEHYINDVLPEKLRIATDYQKNRSFVADIKIIFKTILKFIQKLK